MTCTKNGYIAEWDTPSEMIRDIDNCRCLCCQDKLDELPEKLVDDTLQTTL